jgi:hypothetical protein
MTTTNKLPRKRITVGQIVASTNVIRHQLIMILRREQTGRLLQSYSPLNNRSIKRFVEHNVTQ